MKTPRKTSLVQSSKVTTYDSMASAIMDAFGSPEAFKEGCNKIKEGGMLSDCEGFNQPARSLFPFSIQRRAFIESIRQVAASKEMSDTEYVITLVKDKYPTMCDKDITEAYRTLCEHSDFLGIPRVVINNSYLVVHEIVITVVTLIVEAVNKAESKKSNGWAVLGYQPKQY